MELPQYRFECDNSECHDPQSLTHVTILDLIDVGTPICEECDESMELTGIRINEHIIKDFN